MSRPKSELTHEERVRMVTLGCHMVKLHVNEKTIDLILKTIELIENKRMEATLMDAAHIIADNKAKYEKPEDKAIE